MSVERIAAQLRTAQSREAPAAPGAEPAMHYLIRLHQNGNKEGLRTAIQNLLPEIAFGLRVLDSQGPLAHTYRLSLPGVRAEDLVASPFDLEAALEGLALIDRAEAELDPPIFLEGEQTGTGPGVESEGAFGGDGPTPADRAWALRTTGVNAQAAWQAFNTEGSGVCIGQIDTGVVLEHIELLDALDLAKAFDIIDADDDPTDDLSGRFPFANPGHGTATGSVVISRGRLTEPVPGELSGTADGGVVGSAPGARLVPFRAIRSVIRLQQGNVAAAIHRAIDAGCHIITMSLGGVPQTDLAEAIDRAEQEGLLCLAAAGNVFEEVVYPARYGNCLAVAATNVEQKPWAGSAHGHTVNVSAPGERVWRAVPDRSELGLDVDGGNGTSFAVALTAGVAALWLARHGRDHLLNLAAQRGISLQRLFMQTVMASARRPEPWDERQYGAGIVDAHRLLDWPLDDGQEAPRPEVPVLIASANAASARDDDLLTMPPALQPYTRELFWLRATRFLRTRAIQNSMTEAPARAPVPLSASLQATLQVFPDLRAEVEALP